MTYGSYLPFGVGLLLTGAFSGVFAGLLGIGGGAIIVPALAFALSATGYGDDLVQHVAVGTSLAIIVPTGLTSARAHLGKGGLDIRTLKLWVPPVVAGTLLGSLMASLYSGGALRAIFGFMALFIAANIVLPFQQRAMGSLDGSATAHRISAAVVGYLSALMGTGGGALSVPTMAAFGIPMHKAVGTGSAIGVAIAVAGTIGFVVSGWSEAGLPPMSLGYVNLIGFALVGGVAALTAPIGAGLAHRMETRTLKYVFAIFLAAVGLEMLWKTFG